MQLSKTKSGIRQDKTSVRLLIGNKWPPGRGQRLIKYNERHFGHGNVRQLIQGYFRLAFQQHSMQQWKNDERVCEWMIELYFIPFNNTSLLQEHKQTQQQRRSQQKPKRLRNLN